MMFHHTPVKVYTFYGGESVRSLEARARSENLGSKKVKGKRYNTQVGVKR
jgi:hypothetical protein